MSAENPRGSRSIAYEIAEARTAAECALHRWRHMDGGDNAVKDFEEQCELLLALSEIDPVAGRQAGVVDGMVILNMRLPKTPSHGLNSRCF